LPEAAHFLQPEPIVAPVFFFSSNSPAELKFHEMKRIDFIYFMKSFLYLQLQGTSFFINTPAFSPT
jgi:hypothetical protein